MKADRILFLGNSITLVGPPNYWGASASAAAKDYAHLLTQRINDAAKGSLTITPPHPAFGRWYVGNPGPDWDGNLLNIADIFERNYDTWDSVRIQKQIASKPDIVVLQFGENIPMQSFDPAKFKNALKTLLTDLKKSSNPEIFMPSYILGANATVDTIKRDLCAEDPARRVFVDLGKVGPDATRGAYAHPNDDPDARPADVDIDGTNVKQIENNRKQGRLALNATKVFQRVGKPKRKGKRSKGAEELFRRQIRAVAQVLDAYGLLDGLTYDKQEELLGAIVAIFSVDKGN